MNAPLTLTFNTSFGVYINAGAHGLVSGQAVLITDVSTSNALYARTLYAGVVDALRIRLYADSGLLTQISAVAQTISTSMTVIPLGVTSVAAYANVYGVYPIYEQLDDQWINNGAAVTWNLPFTWVTSL